MSGKGAKAKAKAAPAAPPPAAPTPKTTPAVLLSAGEACGLHGTDLHKSGSSITAPKQVLAGPAQAHGQPKPPRPPSREVAATHIDTLRTHTRPFYKLCRPAASKEAPCRG